MAYIGAGIINAGTETNTDLRTEMELAVMSAFESGNKFIPLIERKMLVESPTGRFIIEGKEDRDDNNLAEYGRGTQVDITEGSQDEVYVNCDRPTYVARRIDKFEQKTSSIDIVSMYSKQMGSKLAGSIDRKIASAIELSSLSTGLVSNGDGTVVLNHAIASGATAIEKGDALCDAIWTAVSALQENDVMDTDIYVAVSPTNYGYLGQSSRGINKDYTNSNGDYAEGTIERVAGAIIVPTNNMPKTAGLEALMFTSEAVGFVEVWDITVSSDNQIDFLDASLITASYANGVAPLRPACAVSIKSA